jgi:hypothetical protein
MYIFAHVFCGILLGLGFWQLTGDRRAVLLCIAGSLLPDLIDKPAGILVPALYSGRTIDHSVLVVIVAFFIALIILRYRNTLLGVAVAFCILVHQILDAMWQTPPIWFFPLLGPFHRYEIPDYIGYHLWFQITTPAEWVFLVAAAVLLIGFMEMPSGCSLPASRHTLWFATAVLLSGLGIFLVAAILSGYNYTIAAPTYTAMTNVMAGALAFCGLSVLVQWYRSAMKNS